MYNNKDNSAGILGFLSFSFTLKFHSKANAIKTFLKIDAKRKAEVTFFSEDPFSSFFAQVYVHSSVLSKGTKGLSGQDLYISYSSKQAVFLKSCLLVCSLPDLLCDTWVDDALWVLLSWRGTSKSQFFVQGLPLASGDGSYFLCCCTWQSIMTLLIFLCLFIFMCHKHVKFL